MNKISRWIRQTWQQLDLDPSLRLINEHTPRHEQMYQMVNSPSLSPFDFNDPISTANRFLLYVSHKQPWAQKALQTMACFDKDRELYICALDSLNRSLGDPVKMDKEAISACDMLDWIYIELLLRQHQISLMTKGSRGDNSELMKRVKKAGRTNAWMLAPDQPSFVQRMLLRAMRNTGLDHARELIVLPACLLVVTIFSSVILNMPVLAGIMTAGILAGTVLGSALAWKAARMKRSVNNLNWVQRISGTWAGVFSLKTPSDILCMAHLASTLHAMWQHPTVNVQYAMPGFDPKEVMLCFQESSVLSSHLRHTLSYRIQPGQQAGGPDAQSFVIDDTVALVRAPVPVPQASQLG